MVSSGNSRGNGRGSGFSEAELSEMFVHIESILPITSNDWELVTEALSENFSGRTTDAVRRKFNKLVRAKPSTGDPECPWAVRKAKTLLLDIRKKCEMETESDLENLDSDSEDGLLEPKVSGTGTGTEIEIVESILIDDNQVNGKSTGTSNGIVETEKSRLPDPLKKSTTSKRKQVPKVSRVLHFDDMPLSPVGRLKRPAGGFKMDQSDPMIEYMRMRDIRMEEENRKRWEERKRGNQASGKKRGKDYAE